jgi:hypothetical protein
MFKISYTVDDKRLPEMIRATFDHVTDLKVTPMDAAPAATTLLDKPRSHHKVKLSPPPQPKKVLGAPIKNRNFIQDLGWKRGFKFGGNDVGKRCASLGLDTASRWYVIGNEVKHGRVKKIGLGRYEVI